MAGFVSNYMKIATDDPRGLMHGFTPEQVPVISQLARSFGVSDRWHASAPNQTWPNRFFVLTRTAAGLCEQFAGAISLPDADKLQPPDPIQRSWRIYFHDVPLTATLSTWSVTAVTATGTLLAYRAAWRIGSDRGTKVAPA